MSTQGTPENLKASADLSVTPDEPSVEVVKGRLEVRYETEMAHHRGGGSRQYSSAPKEIRCWHDRPNWPINKVCVRTNTVVLYLHPTVTARS